ncbi:MAG TPA: alpha/beta hydrolase [Methylovirgula sp.]|nr:alpha/beta hydrolase [Methylovirgula sp.]
MIQHATTPLLNIAYEAGGPVDGTPLLLLHGWPDDIHAFDHVAPVLQAANYRTIIPYLRGFGPTRFLSATTMRSGQITAMAQDALDLADHLKLGRFAVVGHDWGARIAYLLASVFPERVTRIAALSVGWQPGGLTTPDLNQARHYWYQWFMATERGAETVRKSGKAFARYQWETWGPKNWFAGADFETTARSFANPDWPEITLHSYRVRWGEAAPDPRYAALEQKASVAKAIAVPTLMIQGGADNCTLPRATEGKEPYFKAPYRRHVLPGIGHFPPREAPQVVNELLLDFLKG